MKKQKRDPSLRAYKKGYHAGLSGRSSDICPFDSLMPRASWLNGWREGRDHQFLGMTGIASVHNMKVG